MIVTFDIYGRPQVGEDTSGMLAPARCLRCGHVHDASKVEPTARYADCTVWRCPRCKAQIDDRAGGWGGSERVR